mgnify:CR=1 FL=1
MSWHFYLYVDGPARPAGALATAASDCRHEAIEARAHASAQQMRACRDATERVSVQYGTMNTCIDSTGIAVDS